jgi:hypothetical protein
MVGISLKNTVRYLHSGSLMGLPQVIPQPELEAWLAKRVTFHSSNREALRTALKTYLNGGKAIVDAAGPGSAVPAASTWVEDIDDDPATAPVPGQGSSGEASQAEASGW